MKIKRIFSKNFMGIKNVDISINDPVVLFYGRNAQGKSCILQSIRAALNGNIEGILKKNINMLVNENESKGAVGIETDYNYDGHDGKFSFKIPSCNGINIDKQSFPYLKYCLDSELIIKEKNEEIKKIFFNLLSSVDSSNVAKKINEAGIPIEFIAKLDLTSFESTIDQCNNELISGRAAWKTITGHNYGSEKAENFEIEEISFNKNDIINCKNELQKMRDNFESLLKKSSKNSLPSNIIELRTKSGNLETAKKVYLNNIKKFESAEITKEQAQQTYNRAMGNVKTLDCVKCGQSHILKDEVLIASVKHNSSIDLSKIKESIDLANKVYNLIKKELDESKDYLLKCEAAKLAIQPFENMTSNTDDTEIILSEINLKREQIKEFEEKIREIESLERKNELNKNIKIKADSYNNDIKNLIKYIEIIKQQKDLQLSEFIKPVNERLQKHSLLFNTGLNPNIEDDFSLTAYNGRPFILLSESDKWKISIMLSECISFFSETKLLLIDRVDILAPQDRGLFFKWLISLTEKDEIDTVICCATMKEKLEKWPKDMDGNWIEQGEIA